MSKQRHKTAALRQNAEAYLARKRRDEFLATHIQVECGTCDEFWPFDHCPECDGKGHVWVYFAEAAP